MPKSFLRNTWRLLIAAALYVLIPPAAISGDLGSADLDFQSIPDQTVFEKNIMCTQLHLDRRKYCKVEIKEGRLVVDGSRGITPSQVKHVSWFEEITWSAKRFEIIYNASDGKLMRAEINTNDGRQSERFYKALLIWLNSK